MNRQFGSFDNAGSRSIMALPRISGVPAIRAVGFKDVLEPHDIRS
jgi:hypothetical protein